MFVKKQKSEWCFYMNKKKYYFCLTQNNLLRMKTEEIITIAKQTISEEAQAVAKLVDYIDDDFTKSMEYILQSKGACGDYGYREECYYC